MSDFFLFGVVPYIAMVLFFVVTVQRYRTRKYSYSSLSSQFLENKQHFWGSVPFHYGIIGVLVGHVGAFLFPRQLLGWNAEPWRLYALEITGMALGLLTLVGLVLIIIRRARSSRLRKVSTLIDWMLYVLLLTQIVSGVWIAYSHAWGSSWFASNAAPWLWSLVKLSPDVSFVAPLPHMIKLHIVNAFLLIAVFPFTRLVHILVIPNMYLWRKPQVVLWNNKGTKGGAG